MSHYTGTMPAQSNGHKRVRPKLLVCDLDGTLVDSHGQISRATVDALRLAGEAGIETAIATGRRHSFAERAIVPLGLGPDTVLISSNGAVVRTLAGETIHRTTMPPATARMMCRNLGDFRESLIFTFDCTGSGSLVVEDVEALHRRIPRWVGSNRDDIVCCTPLARAFDGNREPIQAMICGGMQEMGAAMAALMSATSAAVELRESVSIHRTEYAARDLCIVDFLPVGCSKGAAVAYLAALRGLDATQVAAIGDNMNDADMLAFAGLAFVMRNAAEELHEMASRNDWTTTGSHDEDGAAEAILRVLEKTLEVPARKPVKAPTVTG